MKKTTIKENLDALGILPQEIVNAHVHLPEVNAAMLTDAVEEGEHPMIPRRIITETIPLISPRNFYKLNRAFSGSAVILPVGAHNINGKACMLYCSNEHVLKLAHRYPDFYIPFATVNLSSESAPEYIQILRERGMLGVKYHALEGYSLIDPRCHEGLRMLERLGMPLVIHLGDTPFQGVDLRNAHPDLLIPLSNEFPRLRILATHFATPLHNTLFWIASRYDNIYLDTAEFPIYWRSHVENPYGGLLNPLNTRRIGIHKFIFGTDFPMPTFQRNSDGQIIVAVQDTAEYLHAFLTLPDTYLTPAEKRQVLCENFWQFLGIPKDEVILSNRQILKPEKSVTPV